MKIEQNKNELNDYIWSGLTAGKLLAIIHALEDTEIRTTLQGEVLFFLNNAWDERKI